MSIFYGLKFLHNILTTVGWTNVILYPFCLLQFQSYAFIYFSWKWGYSCPM